MKLPSYAIVDAAVDWSVIDALTLSAHVRNATDKTYALAAYGPNAIFGMPRTWELRARYRFQRHPRARWNIFGQNPSPGVTAKNATNANPARKITRKENISGRDQSTRACLLEPTFSGKSSFLRPLRSLRLLIDHQ